MAVSVILILTTVVGVVAGEEVTIGKCNLTFFTFGGQQCQRIMIQDLKNDHDLTCSIAYDNQTSCVKSHVGACVSGDSLLSGVSNQISKLMSALLYHCGNRALDVDSISPIIINYVKCSPAKLKQMETCWKDFHSTFNENRNDSSLCRKYAEGKQRCSNVAREACGLICNHIMKDEYNPFCANFTDPPGTSELYDCSQTLGCKEALVYEEAVNCEIQGFEDFANMTEGDCSSELEKNKVCLKNKLINRCSKITNSPKLFEDVVKVLRSTLMTQRFFCKKVDQLDLEAIDSRVKPTAPCKDEFFDAAETCAKNFRSKYIAAKVKKDKEICIDFANAKKCLNDLYKEHCSFDEDTSKAAFFDARNPFCESGKDPITKSRADKAHATVMVVFVSSLLAILQAF